MSGHHLASAAKQQQQVPRLAESTARCTPACTSRTPNKSSFCRALPSPLSPRWDPSRAGRPYEFVGTPDFAAAAVLTGQRPGLRDDLEALGYTLLELALGELPW